MRDTTTVIVGAGHCGLAMSRCLAARSVDHVVLERGQVANSWRTQRWDSLRLLTPNWMTRLPGYAYRGPDPDGYLSAAQVAAMLADYAGASAAPVLTGVTVTSVRAAGGGYVVETGQGSWRAPTVVPAAPLGLDLRSGAISTIIWATGYRPDLSWLEVPVLDRRGRVVHDGGVTTCPGLYPIGLPFLRRRKSSLIDGAAGDAAELTGHLAGYLDALAGRRARSAS